LKVTTAKYYIPSGRCIQALDYTHRNEDGSVGHVPDSLIKEFKTRAGRKVFDGGGILPDIKLAPERLSDLTYNLYSKNFIFNYATEFAQKHETIASAREFKIDDAIYSDFGKYLVNKDFEYKTKTEESLSKLIETAKKEKYYEGAVNEIKQLKEKLAHDKSKDLITFRNEISELIVDEIITRYYYQKGKIEATFATDKEISKAIEVLDSNTKYSSIITGKETIAKKDTPVEEIETEKAEDN
jgi:carboxyl-terminal processing protease